VVDLPAPEGPINGQFDLLGLRTAQADIKKRLIGPPIPVRRNLNEGHGHGAWERTQEGISAA